jgi:hypothetical protein
LVIIGLTAPMTAALADQGTVPPGQLPELTAEWWQWALSIPTSVNPLTDATGDFCMVGQRGPIWFLAGNGTGEATVTRTCSVPADKTLFFPVINGVNISIPKDVCGSTGLETAKQLRADIKPTIDAAENLSVTVDGQPVKKVLLQRVQSEVFDVAFPADNLFGGGSSCPSAIYSPAVDDGYYVSLAPLKPGSHTIHFQGKDPSTTQDVTYDLTVVPVLLK